MSDEPEKKPINHGEPVVLQEPKEEGSTGGGCSWAAPAVLIIAIIGTIVILALAPGQSEAPPSTIVTYAPGIPTPTTSLPVSGASSGSIPCQPGIELGKTAVVVYDAVRMRQSPGFVGKNDAVDTVHYLEKGDIVNVNGGPEQKDGLCWWLVVQTGVQGWSADHSSDGTLLLSAGS